ncbi:hypothetical protein MSLAZ_2522 [Methanosarcina lacustris Z-7289]|uniref:Uncharacterized protein n=1 Tax=Methanosarcina lacustris Z-7289 TaxID=1434111 RepID=A0A0E3S9E6_9EURY|nr:DUF927 domain-containing protein [Methanosarcina lacustris]AKB75783.1 hypothetical protein MSLAZ_2522 [Methanosarcina lacustris Z-7289]
MVLDVNIDPIPTEMKTLNHWAVWKTEEVKDRGDQKVSYYAEKMHSNVLKPKTWLPFESAIDLLQKNPIFEGLSFILTADLGIVGVDYDNTVTEDGEFDNTKLEELRALHTYTEISPSGQGIRAFCYARLPNDKGKHSKKYDLELYSTGKVLTVTGHHVEGTPLTLNEAQGPINALYDKHFPPQTSVSDDSILPRTQMTFSDVKIIQLLENGAYAEQFKDLFYEGDLSQYNNDHSAADWDMCRRFIYYTQKPEQVDRLFRKSKLIRPKWDETHGEGTYGEITIKNCLLTRKKVYMGGPYIGKSLLTSEYPYIVTDKGIYKIKPTNSANGDTVESTIEICSTPCTIIAVGRNLDNKELLYKLLLRDPEDIEKEIWKSPSELLQKKGVMQLQKEGLLFTESNSGDLTDFFKIVIKNTIKTLPKEYVASRSGWKKDFSLIVVGNRAISASGEATVLQRDNPTAELYTQKGDLNSWVGAAKELLDYSSVRFKLYSACAPPLLKLLNMPSFVETQQVKSGNLKTTTGWLAASLWGDPERLQINAASTAVGITKIVEFCTDLPIFVDETSITDSIKDLVYLIANGVGRSKGNSEGGLVMPSTWSTVLLTTGEKPILPESALTGQQVRVIPLREGVNKKLKPEVVNHIQTTIKTNYGHVGVLFLRELFKEKDNLTSLYQAFFRAFPEVESEDITSDRAKGYYAVIALAGYLLEKVFETIGIEAKDPYSVCEHYFTENVISNNFVPDYVKVLSAAYSWYSANEVYFRDEEEERPLNHERYGWIRDDKEHGCCVCFIPDKLKKYINIEIGPNTYEAVTDEWKNLEILIPKTQKNKDTGAICKLTKNQISVDGRKEPVIKIPFDKFYEHLKLEDENKENLDSSEKSEDNNKPQVAETLLTQTTFKAPSVGVQVVSIDASEKTAETTATANNIIIASNDAELAEIMEQEGIL